MIKGRLKREGVDENWVSRGESWPLECQELVVRYPFLIEYK